MVAETAVKVALATPSEDLSWLFEAERLSVAVNPDGPGFIVKGTETLYLVTTDPPSCECPRWTKAGKECAHIRAARRPPTLIRCGHCPVCGDDAVSEVSYVEGRGYLMRARCWSSFGDDPSCDWARVL